MKPLKIYLDTSVWNFYFADDAPEKRDVTRRFFENLPESGDELYIAEPVFIEIDNAGPDARNRLYELVARFRPFELKHRAEAYALAEEYVNHGALPPGAATDALHIAYASVAELDCIASWNMRHIANVRKQDGVQAVNLLNGYGKRLRLTTPYEVSEYEDD